MRIPNYCIEKETDEFILIRDLGPWDKYPSVTNGAEQVVEQLAPQLKGRRLFYIDSEGQQDELSVEDGQFAGFIPGRFGRLTQRERQKGRSEDYYFLSPQEQWDEDKRLGILDWDGK